MQECGGRALGDSDAISASVMCGTDREHMAALAHSHRFMEADETRHANGCRGGPLAPRRRTSARLRVRVFSLGATAAFHFATFICPRCGLRGPAVVCRGYRCMLTSSRALAPPQQPTKRKKNPLIIIIRRLAESAHPTQWPIPDECITLSERMNTSPLMRSQWVQVFVRDLQWDWSRK